MLRFTGVAGIALEFRQGPSGFFRPEIRRRAVRRAGGNFRQQGFGAGSEPRLRGDAAFAPRALQTFFGFGETFGVDLETAARLGQRTAQTLHDAAKITLAGAVGGVGIINAREQRRCLFQRFLARLDCGGGVLGDLQQGFQQLELGQLGLLALQGLDHSFSDFHTRPYHAGFAVQPIAVSLHITQQSAGRGLRAGLNFDLGFEFARCTGCGFLHA